jgi:hypothetical protein
MVGASSPARGWEFFSSPPCPDRLWGPPGAEEFLPGGKAAGREADHSRPSSVEVKNAWSYTSTPAIRLHGVVLRWSTGTTLCIKLLVLTQFSFRMNPHINSLTNASQLKISGGKWREVTRKLYPNLVHILICEQVIRTYWFIGYLYGVR